MLQLQEKKRALTASVFGEKFPYSKTLTLKDIHALFRFDSSDWNPWGEKSPYSNFELIHLSLERQLEAVAMRKMMPAEDCLGPHPQRTPDQLKMVLAAKIVDSGKCRDIMSSEQSKPGL